MKCLKCGARMVKQTIPLAGGDPTMRETGGVTGTVAGWSCHCCGKWVDIVSDPVCPMPKIERDPSSVRLRGRLGTPGLTVEKFKEEIRAWRAQGLSWQKISHELKKLSGLRLSLYTVRNSFARIVKEGAKNVRVQ